METVAILLGTVCFLSVVGAQIWLILIIMRGSPLAALLCLVVPFLILYFIRDHWESARKPVLVWIGGSLGLIALAVLSATW